MVNFPRTLICVSAASYFFARKKRKKTMGQLVSQLGFQVGWFVKKPSTNPI